MSRIIRFRCWDGKTMWYPDTITNDGNQTNLTFFNPDRGIKWGLYDSRLENRVVSGEYHHLMQFTGLLDGEGKDIYDGDILRIFYRNDEFIKVVKWNDQWACWWFHSNKLYLEVKELAMYGDENGLVLTSAYVIGNVHQHPELLQSLTSK